MKIHFLTKLNHPHLSRWLKKITLMIGIANWPKIKIVNFRFITVKDLNIKAIWPLTI